MSVRFRLLDDTIGLDECHCKRKVIVAFMK